MKQITIGLPDDVDRAMRAEAARRGMTVSEWVREVIEANLPVQRRRRQLRFVGAGRSDAAEIAESLRRE